jgi:hypothetical protein
MCIIFYQTTPTVAPLNYDIRELRRRARAEEMICSAAQISKVIPKPSSQTPFGWFHLRNTEMDRLNVVEI